MQQGGEEAQRRLSPTQGTATFAGLPRGSQIRQNLERAKCLREVLKWKHLGAQRAAVPCIPSLHKSTHSRSESPLGVIFLRLVEVSKICEIYTILDIEGNPISFYYEI